MCRWTPRAIAGKTPRIAVAAVVVGVALVAAGARVAYQAVRVPNADEGMSYLSASCDRIGYERMARQEAPPYGEWVASETVRAFVEPTHLCPLAVRHGLATYDIHPLVYFWLLHLWALSLGLTAWTASTLTGALGFVTALVLYRFGRDFLGGPFEGIACAAIWAVHPLTLAVGQARPYECLATATALLLWRFAHAVGAPTARQNGLWLAVAVALGMLTHLHFVLVVAGVALVALARWRRHPRELLSMAGWLTGGVAVAAIIHPLIQIVLDRGDRGGSGQGGVGRLADRTWQMLQRHGGFFEPELLAPVPFYAWAAAALTALLLERYHAFRRDRPLGAVWVLIPLATASLGVACLWAVGVSPGHATAPKYFASIWVLSAIAFVALIRHIPLARFALPLLFVVGISLKSYRGLPDGERLRRASMRALAGQNILIDAVNPLHLPRMLARVPPGRRVHLARARSVLENYESFAAGLDNAEYYALDYGGFKKSRKRLLRRLRKDGLHSKRTRWKGAEGFLHYRLRRKR